MSLRMGTPYSAWTWANGLRLIELAWGGGGGAALNGTFPLELEELEFIEDIECWLWLESVEIALLLYDTVLDLFLWLHWFPGFVAPRFWKKQFFYSSKKF